jgi:hypothetical protein
MALYETCTGESHDDDVFLDVVFLLGDATQMSRSHPSLKL